MSASPGRRWWIVNLLWALSVVVCPTWIGRSYTRTASDVWRENGAFGLAGSDGMLRIAPVWSPPTPYSGGISAQLRWPMQSIAENSATPGTADVIEMSCISNSIRLAAGWIVIGALFRIWSWRKHAPLTGRETLCAWRMTQCLFAGMILTFSLGIASQGALWSDDAVAGVLGSSLTIGLLWEICTSRRRSVPAQPETSVASTVPSECAS